MSSADVNVIEVNIPCTDKKISCPFGAPAESLSEHFGDIPGGVAAVRVNNEILPLSTRLEINCTLEPVPLKDRDGVMIYRRSLAFILAVAAHERFPNRSLLIGHSLGHSYYYSFADGKKPAPGDVTALENDMRALVEEDAPISCGYISYGDALSLFKKKQTGRHPASV